MKAVKIAFRGVIGGENLKILKNFIFWFFNFLDRFYTFTRAPYLFTARGSGHRSRSTHFILWPKVAAILSDFPLTANRLKWPQEWWNFSTRSKTKIGASMRDPNFQKVQYPRHLALAKTLFYTFKTVKIHSKTPSKRKKSIKIDIDIMRSPDLPQKY